MTAPALRAAPPLARRRDPRRSRGRAAQPRARRGRLRPVAVPGAGRGAAGGSRGPGPRRRDARPLRLDRVRQRAFGAGAGSRPAADRGRPACARRPSAAQTARALLDAGAIPPPLVADGDGAEALWTRLRDADAVARPPRPGADDAGRTARARRGTRPRPARMVDEVETYRMEVRPAAAIAADWRAAAPDAAVIASPRVATGLVEAIGAGALRDLRGHRRHRRTPPPRP